MPIYTMASASAASGTGLSSVYPATADGERVGIVQIECGTGAYSIQIQGRLDPTASWINLLQTAATADGMYSIAVLPEMRVFITTNGQNVSAWLLA
jgi:hypothetical protein